jgi:aspartokinase
MRELVTALQNIADEASMQIVQRASVSTSIAIEADDIDDLRDALGAITGALSSSDEVECKVSAMKATTDQLWAAYQKLQSTKKVAAQFDTTHSNVIQRLKNAGHTLNRPGRRSWWQQ